MLWFYLYTLYYHWTYYKHSDQIPLNATATMASSELQMIANTEV